MGKKKDIEHYDKNNVPNGYFEHYGYKNKLVYRCSMKKGHPVGYDEYHSIEQTNYHIR